MSNKLGDLFNDLDKEKEKAAPESESESGGQAAQCNLPQ